MPFGLFAARKFFAANDTREDLLRDSTAGHGVGLGVVPFSASETSVKMIYWFHNVKKWTPANGRGE